MLLIDWLASQARGVEETLPLNTHSAHTASNTERQRKHRSLYWKRWAIVTDSRSVAIGRESVYIFFLFVNCCTTTSLISEFQL